MRLVALILVMFAGLLTAEAAAARPCANPVDQGAFDVAALKSELMLVALSCNQRDSYNQFILRFRPDLVREERALNAWFRRAYGRAAQRHHDEYITGLANIESQAGVRRGNLFCYDNAKLFQNVNKLRDIGQLVSFAANQRYPQPIALRTCAQPRHRSLRTAERH